MSNHQPLRGVFAPILTAFENDGSLALDAYVRHAGELLRSGCTGLVPFGTTGEALSVATEERIAGMKALVESGIDPARLIPGTGLTNLPDTLRLTRAAAELGCRGALVLPPFFYKSVAEDGLHAYFARLAESVDTEDFGIYLYHIPQVSGVGFPVGLVRRLHAGFPSRIVGIKDSSGDWSNTRELIGIEGFHAYPGNEMRLLDALEAGAPGCITATANLNARQIDGVIRCFDAGDIDGARERMDIVRGYREIWKEYAPIPGMKFLLAESTGDQRWRHVRPPLLPMSNDAGRNLQERVAAQSAV